MTNFELKNSEGVTFALVSMENDKPWIYIQWIGTMKTSDLKRIMMQYTGFIKENKCHYVLSDRRKSTGDVFEISHFIEHKWASMAVDAGLQAIANVTAPSATSQFTSRDLATRILGFEFKSFDSLEEAEQWLMQRASHAHH